MTTMTYLKVITHDTTFHADDVMAVALLRHIGYSLEVVRTRDPQILAAALADPEIAVLDVGGEYNPLMFNFDHHQDISLQSAAGLIWEHFKNKICPKEAQPFFAKFIASIDAMDTNRDNIFGSWDQLPSGFRNTSGILGGFNRDVTDRDVQDKQFSEASYFAADIILNEIYNAEKKAKSEADYDKRTVLANNIAVFEAYNSIWKAKGDHIMAVMPHANGWQIISKDTATAQVPESAAELDGFVFRHKTGFMAVVKDMDVALEFAESL